ncbi:MAG TPA: PadR family transcriptional regulator, partial [Candidatus Cybelea sp.]
MNIGFWDLRSGRWGMYGPGHRRHRKRFKRGILKFALLKLLAEMPRHGYDLMRAFREKGWDAGAGSVYPILSALEAAGLIAGRDEGDRRTYEISDQGRRLLEEHAKDLGRLFDDDADDASEVEEDRLRDAAGRLMQSIAQLGPTSKPETI